MILPSWWKRNFLWWELGLAIAATGGFAAWGYYCSGFRIVDATLTLNRPDVYGALATIFGSLLGFVIVAVSIVANYATSPRMRIVRESRQYETLWKVFIATIRALALATFAALLALILDRNLDPVRLIMLFVFYATALSALRVARSVWVLENIISIVVKEGREDRQETEKV